MTDRVTVQVVDDHFLFASTLADLVRGLEGYRLTGIAVTGPQALAMVREEQPDIVLLDYHLPGYSANVLLPRLLAVSPRSRVIVITADTSEGTMASAVRAGAIGFMTKDKAIDDVLDALAAATEGRTLLTPEQSEIAGLSTAAPAGSSVPTAAPATLPPSPSPLLGGSPPSMSATATPVDEPASREAAPPSTSARPESEMIPSTSAALSEPDVSAITGVAPAAGAVPLPAVEPPLEVRLVGIGSFAQAVLIERFVDRLPQVEQVHIRSVGDDRASLRVSLERGASVERFAKELVEGSRRLRLTGADSGMLELQVEAPLVDG